MNQPNKTLADNWAAAQQAMWKAFLPAAPANADDGQPARDPTPLEEQFNELRDTWRTSVERWTAFAKESSQGKVPSADKLREMFAPASWSGPGSGVLDGALQRVLEGPRYATLWDMDRQLLELQKLTLQRDKDVAAYQAVVQKAWNLAFERFAEALGKAPEAGAKRTWRALTDQWLAIANDTLIQVHRSDEFMQAQRRMLRAASDRHLQERKIAEAWCAASHIPTRSEVDELQRHAIELRREVRLLRRASGTPASAAATPTVTARKPAATRRAPTAAKRARA